MDSLIETAHDLLEREEAFVMATIISGEGSAPRRSGARLLLTSRGKTYGSVGGGLLEAGTLQAAAETAGGTGRILSFDLTGSNAADMGMICGGRVDVLVEAVAATPENRMLFKHRLDAVRQGGTRFWITTAAYAAGKIERIDRCIASEEAIVIGRCPLPFGTLAPRIAHVKQAGSLQAHQVAETILIIEPCRRPCALFLFGAGHVAQPTAQLGAMAGFRVVVLDDREAFANSARFPEAHTVAVIPSFEAAFQNLEVQADSYIVIATRGHLHDEQVLAQALRTPAAYLGMIGSRRKKEAIYEHLRRSGFTDRDLQRVHCPIGLAIGAQTPEEIAVSIAAELIAVRAQAAALARSAACATAP